MNSMCEDVANVNEFMILWRSLLESDALIFRLAVLVTVFQTREQWGRDFQHVDWSAMIGPNNR